MGVQSLIGLALAGRAIPVVASIALHAGLAIGLVANGGLHGARNDARTTPQELTIDVEPAVEPPEETTPLAASPAPSATHTHDHPVPASHDARPHDPSAPHPLAAPLPSPSNDVEEKSAPGPEVAAAAAPRFAMSGATTTAASTVGSTGTTPSARGSNGGDDTVVPAHAVDVAAKLVQGAPLAYPPEARADDREADVTLEIVVDREGQVIDARVARPASPSFDAAAIAAVRRYRFSPARREGHAVRVRMPWAVQFRLR